MFYAYVEVFNTLPMLLGWTVCLFMSLTCL